MNPKINKCEYCGSIWSDNCKCHERAFWCMKCKRPQDEAGTYKGMIVGGIGDFEYNKPAIQKKNEYN